MRELLLLLVPAALMAQAPLPKSQGNPKPSTVKPAPPKPAAARKPAVAKAKPKPASAPALTTDDEKTIYALGLSMHRTLAQFDLSRSELEIIKRALSDAAAGKPALEIEEWGPRIQTVAKARATRVSEREKAASASYLEKAATEPGAIKTESGLVYREVQSGSGAHPKATDTVKVHYRGTLVNGTQFDSSYQRNEPAEFALNQVIRCWTEGVQKMAVGGKAILVCPSDLAYGDGGRPTIPGGAALIFEIELLAIAGSAP
jgi:FKBP-type peptidyl-prolyl cis-trans isomerase FkpA